jgi:hypothetical protein
MAVLCNPTAMITHATRDSEGYIWYLDHNDTPRRLTIKIFHDAKLKSELYDKDYTRVLFYCVPPGDGSLVDMCRWCLKYYSEDHCTYTPGRFWFDNPEDATMFKLRWG